VKVMVTGAAGFIGFHLARRLLALGHDVLGYDGMTPYYDPALKEARVDNLKVSGRFSLVRAMLEDKDTLERETRAFAPDVVVHLAAQAGVRYSIENPSAYISGNVVGTFNLLETVRHVGVRHLLLASTSSVYGGNDVMPFQETHRADYPVSLYAATKKSCEAMSHSYAHLFGIPTTCFRFFTVYGPWGRPDMALFKFVQAIEKGEPIDVYGQGQMKRDFTYIDDLVEAIVRLFDALPVKGESAAETDSISPVAPWRVVNIGGAGPVGLMEFIEAIERALDKKAAMNMLPMQPGDVTTTYADASLLHALTGYCPGTSVDDGVGAFVEWFRTWQATPGLA
jgi:UDP-glucuronate 4-epimerase